MRNLKQVVVVIIIVLGMSACGGGSSGGSSNSTPPPADDTSRGTLRFSENDNSFSAITLSFASSEAIFRSGQSAINHVLRFVLPNSKPSVSCARGGTVTIEHSDNDQSLTVSSGDVLELEYDACYDVEFDDQATGVARLEITEISVSHEDIELAAKVRFEEGFTLTSITETNAVANLSADYTLGYELHGTAPNYADIREIMRASAAGEEFISVTENNQTERFSRFNLENTFELFAGQRNARANIQSFIESNLLGGSFTCRGENLNVAMDSGNIICTGVNGNAIQFSQLGSLITVDSTGDGNFTPSSKTFTSIGAGDFLFFGPHFELSSVPVSIASRRLPIESQDIQYDAQHGRLLILANTGDNNSHLLALDEETLAVTELIPFSQPAKLIRISDDGQRLFVGLENAQQNQVSINIYDAERLQLLIEKTMSAQTLIDIAVSPEHNERFASAVINATTDGRRFEVSVHQGAEVLPNTASANPAINVSDTQGLTWSSDGKWLLVARFPGDSARVNVDSRGLVDARYFPELGISSSKVHRLADRFIVDHSIFDQETLSLLSLAQTDGSSEVLWVDDRNHRAYVAANEHISLMRSDNLAELGRYQYQGDLLEQVVGMKNYLAIREQDEIQLVALDDLQPNRPASCALSDEGQFRATGIHVMRCAVRAAALNPVSEKLYVAIDHNNGEQGNSLAIIDRTTFEVEQYHPLLSEPVSMAISGDGQYVYVNFRNNRRVLRLTLRNGLVSRTEYIALGYNDTGYSYFPQALYSSPVADDSIVVAASEGRQDASTRRLFAITGGELLPRSIDINGVTPPALGDNVVAPIYGRGFDEDGYFYTHDVLSAPNVPGSYTGQFLSDDSGLSWVQTFYIAPPEREYDNFSPVVIGRGAIINGIGGYIDISQQSYTQRFDIRREPDGFPDVGLLALPFRSGLDAVFFAEGNAQSPLVMRRYQKDTGVLSGTAEIGMFNDASHIVQGNYMLGLSDSMLLVMPDSRRLVFVPYSAFGS